MLASLPRVDGQTTLRPSGLKRGDSVMPGKLPSTSCRPVLEVEQIDPRLVARVGHEGDLLRIRMEARRQRGKLPSVRKRWFSPSWSMIASRRLRRSRGPLSRDVDDAGVEIALLAQQPLIDHVRDQMRDAPPIGRRRGEGGALDLRPAARPTAGTRPAAGRPPPPTRPVVSACAPITRQSWKRGASRRGFRRLDEGGASTGRNRPECGGC